MQIVLSLQKIMKARYGNITASHWVLMAVVASEFSIMEIDCAWSQRCMSYFVPTCGSAEICEEKYLANFEYGFGNVTCKEINRTSICHCLHEVFPIIGKQNRVAQSVLELEKNGLRRTAGFSC